MTTNSAKLRARVDVLPMNRALPTNLTAKKPVKPDAKAGKRSAKIANIWPKLAVKEVCCLVVGIKVATVNT